MGKIPQSIKFRAVAIAAFCMLSLIAIGYIVYNKASSNEYFKGESREEFGAQFKSMKADLGVRLQGKGISEAIQWVYKNAQERAIKLHECHVLLHIVGHEAYRVYGANFEKILSVGTTLCDNGYVHGVEGQIVETRPDPLDELKRFCDVAQKTWEHLRWCYHGAGHGFMQTTLNVAASARLCEAVVGEDAEELEGCYAGVVDQYVDFAAGFDTETGTKFEDQEIVEFDPHNPYEICGSLRQSFRSLCTARLTRVFFIDNLHDDSDLHAALLRCTVNDIDDRAQSLCIEVLAAKYTRTQLYQKRSIVFPSLLLSWGEPVRRQYISGASRVFRDNLSPQLNWQVFCKSLISESDRIFCDSKTVIMYTK